MLETLLPRHADNTMRGSRIALWLFGLVVLLRLVIGLNSIFNTREVASGADGIPLDTFTPAAAQTAETLFALLGLGHLTLAVLGLLVLVRYRALVPLMFVLLLLQQLGRILILHFRPHAGALTPSGSAVTYVLLAAMALGLALSLWTRPDRPSGPDA